VTAILAASDDSFRALVHERLLEAGCRDVQFADAPTTLAAILLDCDDPVVVAGGSWPQPRPFLDVATDAHAPAIVLLHFSAFDAEQEALALGARATLRSDISATALEAALAAVHAGLIVLDRRPAATSRQRLRPALRRLSTREREILSLVASGTSNKGIARALAVSANTVKFHLATVFRKLNAATRAEAVAEAIRRGDISL
jgi:DNA-binding CsgD family transcriptional regulator